MRVRIIKKLSSKLMQGKIKVYECETRESKFGKGDYFAVTGKMAGVTAVFVSDIALVSGEHNVICELNEYKGNMSVRIKAIVKL